MGSRRRVLGSGDETGAEGRVWGADHSGAQGTSLGRRAEFLGAGDETGAQGTSLGATDEMFAVKKYYNRSYF